MACEIGMITHGGNAGLVLQVATHKCGTTIKSFAYLPDPAGIPLRLASNTKPQQKLHHTQ